MASLCRPWHTGCLSSFSPASFVPDSDRTGSPDLGQFWRKTKCHPQAMLDQGAPSSLRTEPWLMAQTDCLMVLTPPMSKGMESVLDIPDIMGSPFTDGCCPLRSSHPSRRRKFKRGLLGIEITSQTAWAHILALPLTGDVTMSKTLPFLGPQSLFFLFSIPCPCLSRSRSVPCRPSLPKGGTSEGSTEFPGLTHSCKGTVQEATGVPRDLLLRVGP